MTAYPIAVERVRTFTALLEWTVHITQKPFMTATDWMDMIDRALHPSRAAVTGLLPLRPRDVQRGPVGD